MTKTAQTATNKELSVGFAEITQTTDMKKKTRESGVQTRGSPNNGETPFGKHRL